MVLLILLIFAIGFLKRAKPDELRATSYELRASSYELRASSYELRATKKKPLAYARGFQFHD